MSSIPPDFSFLDLDTSTICPKPSDEKLFIPYFNRLYENIAFAVNARDFIQFTAPITDKAANIPNMANFGAFLLCVSGTTTGLPSYVWALAKADQAAAGTGFVALTSQVGTVGVWIGATLTLSSTGTNFQINHSVATTIGNFNFRFIGTQ